MSDPLVTVLIPTRNSAGHLPRTLQSVRAQTYSPIEILVVDNHSMDATRTIAEAAGARVLVVGPERSTQLNAGIAQATGSFVYRVDSDFVIDSTVVAECVELCENGGCDAVAVHNDSDPAVSFWSRVRHFERRMYRDDTLIVGARFARTDLLRRIGGFDPELVAGEDYDLHNRLVAAGARIGRARARELHLGEPRSLREVWEKSFFYGRTIGAYVRKHPSRSTAQLNPVRGAFLRNWREFVARPDLGGALVIMLFVRYLAGALGLVSAMVPKLGRSGEHSA